MARDNAVRDMRARDEPILIEVDVERVGVDR
jgi:TPP-dependent pyruvate/acetoin dehydrogenase alpha subunit